MDKFSELKAAAMAATPGPWFRSSVQFNGITTEETSITQGNKPHVASTSEKRDAIFIAAANPDTVLALLAELEFEKQNNAGVAGMAEDYETKLEAKDKRIAELEEQSKQLKKELHNEGAANAYAYERIRELEKRLEESRETTLLVRDAWQKDKERADAAEKRLATPVRLPTLLAAPGEYASGILWAERDTHNATVIECANAIRANGFKVEGDE